MTMNETTVHEIAVRFGIDCTEPLPAHLLGRIEVAQWDMSSAKRGIRESAANMERTIPLITHELDINHHPRQGQWMMKYAEQMMRCENQLAEAVRHITQDIYTLATIITNENQRCRFRDEAIIAAFETTE